MGRIAADRLPEVPAQRSRRRLPRIGRPHRVTPLPDRVRRFKRQEHTRPRRHEVGQLTEKGPLTVHGVEAFCFLLAQMLQPHRPDGKASLINPRQDLPGKQPFNRIRFDDRERSLRAHRPNASRIFVPMSAGLFTTWTPAAVSACIFSAAVPWPPAMIAPACPILRPGGAVWPAMNPTTGLLNV